MPATAKPAKPQPRRAIVYAKPNARHIQRRDNTYYAVLEIPKALRPKFGGKARFVRSLGTSLADAQDEAHEHLAEWRKQIRAARRGEPIGLNGRRGGPQPDHDAAVWLRRLREAPSEEERGSILEQIDMAAWQIGSMNVEHVGDRPSSAPEAQQFYATATGQVVALDAHLDEWIATSRATQKTKDMQSSDVKRFAAKFRQLHDVTRPAVRRWITGLMNEDGLAPKTVQRILSALRGYWRYLQSLEVAGEEHEPFTKLDVARQNKREERRSERQPFEPRDVVRLLNEAVGQEDDKLADLIRLGMWTGCRIEELCALKIDRVKKDSFSVEDAKTPAGWREVPIHRELAPTMRRLLQSSADGFVLSGLSENKYGDRSNAVGKRFGRLKADMGFGEQFVFHSIRKTVATALEEAGVPENVSADILGHDKPTMTYGLYSGGVSLGVKRKALTKLRYPQAV